MKKFILLLSLIALFCQSSFAQTGGLNFQGVARNSTGAVLANQKINLKFSILRTTETGTVEYTETKEVTTNAQGIFAVVVGEVNASSFAAVDWKASPKFLKVEMDPAGGTSFVAMGTTRLQNVPYAYYANGVNANNIDGAVPVSKGGTGATDAAAARTNLGLVIGTNVQAPLTAGTDYLTPTGNAATATKLAAAKKINGVDFDGTNDITIPTVADASTLSGTVSIAKGGTGANSAAGSLTNLGAESIANKSTDITVDASSLTKYPSVKVIKDYVDTRISSTVATITSVNGLQLGRGTGTNLSSIAVGGGLTNNTTGISNIAIGVNALKRNTTGSYNTVTGTDALINNTIGSYNTASGTRALNSNTTGDFNTASGGNALYSNTTGGQNSATGIQALFSNTTGGENTASGTNVLYSNTTGGQNTASGNFALYGNTTGLQNTAIGFQAGSFVITGANNTFIGVNSNTSSGTVSNSTAIGNGAVVTASNSFQLGNTSVTDVKTAGTITAAGYKIPTGTSSQYLMADGTISTGILSSTVTNKLVVGSASETTSSAVLEANSNSKGFLPPRMTNSERNAISNPVEGLMIWNTTENEINVFNGSLWVNMSGFTNQTVSIGMKYQGGIVIYVLDNPNPDQYTNPQNFMIISSTDLNPDLGIIWSPTNAVNAYPYPGIKSGNSNTDRIVYYFESLTYTVGGVRVGTNLREYAAGLTRVYRGGGYSDWHLPSKDELNLAFQNRNLIGVFDLNSWYWSSSKGTCNDCAWAQNLFNGNQATKSYDTKYKVRAVRWF